MKKRTFIYIILISCCFSLSSFNFLSNETIIRISNSTNSINSYTNQQHWFINTKHGLIFETPSPLIDKGQSIPLGTEKYMSKLYTYTCLSKQVGLNYIVMETRFNKYNTQTGLQGAITNEINHMGGQDLKLVFKKSNNPRNLYSDGTFNFENHQALVKGYCLFKNKNIYIIIAFGADKTESRNALNRIFNSINEKKVI